MEVSPLMEKSVRVISPEETGLDATRMMSEERGGEMTNQNEWKKGIAFVRGLNMFGSARITKNKMRELCEQIEGENLKVERIYGTDNIVFRKRNMHYATVGQKLEEVLEEHFDKKVHVTCRSMRTVKGLIRNGS